MMVGAFSGVKITEIVVEKGSDDEKRLTEKLSEFGVCLTYPVLETQDDLVLTQSKAICEFLAETGKGGFLLGTTPFEKAQVDQWMQYIQDVTLQTSKAISACIYGTLVLNTQEHLYVYNQLKESLRILNNHSKQKMWICGTDQPTLADLMLGLATQELMQCSLDTNTRNSLNNLNPIFKKIVALPEYKARMGNIKQCKKHLEIKTAAPPKEIKAKAQAKKKQ